VIPAMIKQGGGVIINLSGGGSVAPAPYYSAYACSKAGVVRFTDTLSAEVLQYGIRVFAMGPGLVRTEMTEFLLREARVAEYAPWFPDAMARGADVPPEHAAQLAVFLTTLSDPRLSGRLFRVGTDYSGIESQIEEVAREDLHTLRLRLP